MSKTSQEHKSLAPIHLNFAVFMCSTSRYSEMKQGKKVEDPSGDLIVKYLEGAGHKTVLKKIISDSRVMIQQNVQMALDSENVNAIITCGGTGISPRDVTIESVKPLFEKELDGFGEIFRRLSFDEIGSAAVLSRATAGLSRGKVVFCIPGSPQAVSLCFERLILPEVSHILKHATEE